jgi:hypothetical protein
VWLRVTLKNIASDVTARVFDGTTNTTYPVTSTNQYMFQVDALPNGTMVEIHVEDAVYKDPFTSAIKFLGIQTELNITLIKKPIVLTLNFTVSGTTMPANVNIQVVAFSSLMIQRTTNALG